MKKVAIKPFRPFEALKPSKKALTFSTVYTEEQLKETINDLLKNQPSGQRQYFILEPKYDGVRCVLSKEGNKIGFRSDDEHSFNLGRLKVILDSIKSSSLPDSCVLDGELYMKGSEGQSSQGHQAIAGFLHSGVSPTAVQLKSLQYDFWDILYLNGKDLSNEELRERKRLLPKINKPHFAIGAWIESPVDYSTLQKNFKKIVSAEGLLIKDPYSTYWEPNRLFKIKYEMDIDVEVGEVLPKSGGVVYLAYIRGQKEPVGLTYKTAYLKNIKRGDVIRVMVTKVYAKKKPDGTLVYHWYSPTPRNPSLQGYIYKQMTKGAVIKRPPSKQVDDIKYMHAMWEASGSILK
jgi:ATP-dependent DNA ligase